MELTVDGLAVGLSHLSFIVEPAVVARKFFDEGFDDREAYVDLDYDLIKRVLPDVKVGHLARLKKALLAFVAVGEGEADSAPCATVPAVANGGSAAVAMPAAANAGAGDVSLAAPAKAGGAAADVEEEGCEDEDAPKELPALTAARAKYEHFPFVSDPAVPGPKWFIATSMADLPDVASPPQRRLFQWAYLGGWQDKLARMARNEFWGNRLFVLTNYVEQVFGRLLREGKVFVHGEGPGRRGDMVVFNTGLLTRTDKSSSLIGGKELIAVLSPRTVGGADGKKWGFMVPARSRELDPHQDGVFVTAESLASKSRFHGCPMPERAKYTEDPSELMWDLNEDATLFIDTAHLLDKEKNHFRRLPVEYHDRSRQELAILVDGAVREALAVVKTNFRMAVPQFYRNRVQLLLPLYLRSTDRADLALVLRRDVDASGVTHYTIKTWLRLSWAYLNARLLTRVDQGWLKDGLREDADGPAHTAPEYSGGRKKSGRPARGRDPPMEPALRGASGKKMDASAKVFVPSNSPTAPPHLFVGTAAAPPGRVRTYPSVAGARPALPPPPHLPVAHKRVASFSAGDAIRGAPSSAVTQFVPRAATAASPPPPRRVNEDPSTWPSGFPSLWLPCVANGTSKMEVHNAFSEHCGVVSKVDMVPKNDRLLVFVHFTAWHRHAAPTRASLVDSLRKGGKDKDTITFEGRTWRFAARHREGAPP